MFKLVISVDAGEALHVHLANQCRSYRLQATIFQEALLSQLPISRGAERLLLRYHQDILFFAVYLYTSVLLRQRLCCQIKAY